VEEARDVRALLDELANDAVSAESRADVCEAIGVALARVGRMLWVMGYMFGLDRKFGTSPFRFGDDRAVGIAMVAQIGGALGKGAALLLNAGNQYGASALIRQIVEVEYLAHAFANEQDEAADWLRVDRKKRLSFWSPGKLRDRAEGIFLPSDCWRHCELGGHPTMQGMALLPEHSGLSVAYLWADLSGHLVSVWHGIVISTEWLLDGPIPEDWKLPDVEAVVDAWRNVDGLSAALRDLSHLLRDERAAASS
jgi:hypothetical protein